MTPSLHAQIAEQAYFLWLDDGMHHGHADRHWLAAERIVAQRLLMPAKPKKARVATKATVRPARKRAEVVYHA